MNVTLLVVQGRPSGKKLVFPEGEYYIGRGEECHIRPDSEWVSRQHCLLRVLPQQLIVRDLGSRNGTLVNGVLTVGESSLRHGDHLQIGPLVFEVGFEQAPQALCPTGIINNGETVKDGKELTDSAPGPCKDSTDPLPSLPQSLENS